VYNSSRVDNSSVDNSSVYNSRVYNSSVDNSSVSIDTLSISGTTWMITYTDTHIKIGCRNHTYAEWENFTDREISKMDNNALEWWNEWKGLVLSLALKHRQKIAKK
jgi:hypothetical protein